MVSRVMHAATFTTVSSEVPHTPLPWPLGLQQSNPANTTTVLGYR